MGASYPTKVKLAFRSGDVCALPDCQKALSSDSQAGDPVLIGVAAHIAGEHAGTPKRAAAARFDPSMSDEERDSYHNLIYLCPSCHTKIDAIPQGEQEYPIDRLLKTKSQHETRVRQSMEDGFAEIGFTELEAVTAWVSSLKPDAETQEFSLIRVQAKIDKNQLSSESRGIIAMGLGVASEVARHIESMAQLDQDFPQRLIAGFLAEYYRLRQEGVRGDDLFDSMCQFAQQGFARQAQRAAGLAVLIHLFESCEVFEK